jgi:hypothetical protein
VTATTCTPSATERPTKLIEPREETAVLAISRLGWMTRATAIGVLRGVTWMEITCDGSTVRREARPVWKARASKAETSVLRVNVAVMPGR